MLRCAVAGALLAAIVVTAGPAAADADTERISADIFGGDANGDSRGGALSDDGRFVAFQSVASDLVENDANALSDIFLRDRSTDITARVSLDAGGGDPNGTSIDPDISDDGTVVAFRSVATDLPPGDGMPSHYDLFVRDLEAGTTVLANLLPDGSVAELEDSSPFNPYDLSGDGHHVAFGEDDTGNVIWRDLETGTSVLVGPGDSPSIDDTGTRVAFETNHRLVPEDTDSRLSVYVWDRPTDEYTLASVSLSGGSPNGLAETANISGDGTAVAFVSKADDLVTTPVQTDGDIRDLFVRDLVDDTIVQVSVPADGQDNDKDYDCPSLTDDGQLIAFCTNDRDATPDPDGPAAYDTFVRDLDLGLTAWVASDQDGGPPSDDSFPTDITGDGSLVAFFSEATDFVPNDHNGMEDVFVTPVEPPAPPMPVVSVGSADVAEGGNGRASVAVPLVLSQPVGGPVTVDWSTVPGTATSPSDYDAASGTATFPAGEVTARVDVAVRGDTAVEGDESFTIHLSGVEGAGLGTADGPVVLRDDELPTLAIGDVATPEGTQGQPHVVVPVRLSAPATSAVTASFTTVDGTAVAGNDYVATSGVLTIAAGRTNGKVEVALIGDPADGLDEFFTVELSSVAGAFLTDGSGRVDIRDDDPSSGLLVAVGDVALPEGDAGPTGYAQFPVVLSRATSANLVVDYETADGTAVAPGDYTAAAGSLTIPAGETWGTIQVRVEGDPTTEPDETFSLTITDVSRGTVSDGAAVGTVVEDDADRLVLAGDVTVDEGDEGSPVAHLTIVLDRLASQPVRVDWVTADGTAEAGEDYVAASGTAVIGRNRRSAVIAVTLMGDPGGDAADETFEVLLSNPVRADIVDSVGFVTIRDDDG